MYINVKMCDLKRIVNKKNIIYLKSQIYHKCFSSYQKLYQCEIKLQTKIQITELHKAKYNSITSKEDC